MNRVKRILVIVLVVLVVALAAVYAYGSWYFADILINSPTQSLAQSEARAAFTLDELELPPPEEISVPSGDITLAGWYFDNPADGACGVILLHGYTGTRYGTLQYVPLFWERGCDLVMYDARAHGASGGEFHTYGYYEKRDGQAVLDWLMQRTGLAPGDIGLVGVSYGAATALQMAPLTPDVAFILADSPYQDLRTIVSYQATQQFGDWVQLFVPGALLAAELRADFDVAAVSPQNAVVGSDTPIFLIHSLQDEFTPPSHSEAIFTLANPETAVLHLTDWGAPHGMSIFEDFATYEQWVDEFLAAQAPDFGRQDE